MTTAIDLLRLSELSTSLIRFPTVTGKDLEIHNCIHWIKEHALARVPAISCEEFEYEGSPSLLLKIGDGDPRILLTGHLDVVEAHSSQAFEGAIDDSGYLRGRGAADMKGPIAALLDLIETEPQDGLALLLTTDEESGGFKGVKYVLNTIPWKPDVVILPDGGSNLRLVVEQKGFYILHAWSQSEAVTVDHIHENNPIERILKAYDTIQQYFPTPLNEEDWKRSLTLTQVYGQSQANGKPRRADATFDFRFPGTSLASATVSLREISRHFSGYGVEIETTVEAAPYSLEQNSPYLRALQHFAGEIIHKPLPLMREAGSSDARHFAAKGIPVLVFQPECGEWHHEDEWMNLNSLLDFRAICSRFIQAHLS